MVMQAVIEEQIVPLLFGTISTVNLRSLCFKSSPLTASRPIPVILSAIRPREAQCFVTRVDVDSHHCPFECSMNILERWCSRNGWSYTQAVFTIGLTEETENKPAKEPCLGIFERRVHNYSSECSVIGRRSSQDALKISAFQR
jgi:hypothetical protein